MTFLYAYGLFFAKALTLLVFFLLAVAGIALINRKAKPKLEILSLNQEQNEIRQRMAYEIKNKKTKKKKEKLSTPRPSLYVIDFHGDIKGTDIGPLKEAINALLSIAETGDEVLIRLESGGGIVNSYGLAASQLQRIRQRGIQLTVCIDKVAASGGYLMACVANRLIAAPFAMVGSIGVVAQLPNFHRWLKKNDIDVELLTAGEYKRTLTLFGENTSKGREKFQEDLETIHQVFKNYVLANRPQLEMDKVATGEHWLGVEALDLNLVDEIKTSDDYLSEQMKTFNAFQIKVHVKKSFFEKLRPHSSLSEYGHLSELNKKLLIG
ncbi:MAG: protease SohB [Legionella sp.]|nr:protease SohB [Legionella sp.]